jgi:hypothetical protein
VSFRFIGGIMAPAAGSGVSNPAPRAPAPHIDPQGGGISFPSSSDFMHWVMQARRPPIRGMAAS